jgi:Domain of unknown function (DUF4374)
MNKPILATALLSATAWLAGCLVEDKEKANDDGLTPRGEYVIGITSQGEEGTDYLMTAASLTDDTISPTGRGIEQTGWRYMASSHGHYLSIGYWSDNNFIAYAKDPADKSRLIEKGRFTFPVTIDQYSGVDSSSALAIEIPRKGFVPRTLFRIDLAEVSIADTAIHPIWESRDDSLGAQPVSVLHRDGKVFVAFYPIHARGDFSTPQTDTAYVGIFNYPSLDFDKVIKDPRGGALGMYGNTSGLIKTASDDIYSYSCASNACFTTDSTVGHSKVLRIKNGATEFDPTYEWDFQAATGKKLTWFAPIGGELAIARVMDVSDLEADGKPDPDLEWVALGFAFNQDLAILNLANKTFSPVTDVPTHGGEYCTNVYVEDGKVYMNIVTEGEAAIYAVDIDSKTGVKGAGVIGAGVKMIAR